MTGLELRGNLYVMLMNTSIDFVGSSRNAIGSVARTVGRIVRAIGGLFGFFKPEGVRQPGHLTRKGLLAEIVKLESRLDHVYARVARGSGVMGIDELLSQASDIREQLREKRTWLSRLRYPRSNGFKAKQDFNFERAVQQIIKDSQKIRMRAISRANLRALDILGTASAEEVYEDEDETSELEFESLLDGDL